MDQLQMLREQLPTDPSEIESHLLSHFASELGGREEGSHYGVEVHSERDNESEIDIKVQQKPTYNVVNIENQPKTRARPRKPYEPKPFLSIGNVPNNRQKLDPLMDMRQKSFVSNPNVPFNTPSRMMQSQNSNIRSMSVMSSEWNSVVPKRHKYSHSAPRDVGAIPAVNNVHVLAPFKHSTTKSSAKGTRPLSPSQALKDKTVMATHIVAKVMAKQKPEPSPRSAGRLLKGKLKPMTPVTVNGPSMNQCRGIQPQGQVYTASPSRTLQRRRHILSTLVAKDILNAAKQERPTTVESVHRTSVASSLEEERENDFKDQVEEEAKTRTETFEAANDQNVTENKNEAKTEVQQASSHPIPTHQAIDSGIDPINMVRESNLELTIAAIDSTAIEQDKKQNSFFVTDQENDETSRYGESMEGVGRPKTAIEAQRRVRFSDHQNENSVTDVRRSKSASARLHEESNVNESNKKNKSSKKSQKERGQGDINKDNNKRPPDDDNKDGGQGNNGGTQGNFPSYQGDSGGNQGQDNSNDNNQGNTNNNGNQERQQVLRMSISDMKEGFMNPDIAEKRRRPVSGRPKSKLGFWEDQMKPDAYVQDLSINTQKDETALVPYTGHSKKSRQLLYSSNSTVAFGRSRPASAGPSAFKAAEKQRLIVRARPQSAKVHDAEFRVESYGAQLNNRSQPFTARCQSAKSARSVKGKRYIDLSVYENEDQTSMNLSGVVQHTKAVLCGRCGQTSFNVCDGSILTCEKCHLLEHKQNHEESEIQINGTKLQADEQRNDDKQTDDDTSKSVDGLLMNMDEIEASLNEVQQQIRECINGNRSPIGENLDRPPSRTSGFMESILSMDAEEQNQNELEEDKYDDENVESNIVGLNGGLSQHLTGNKRQNNKTNITVYQYNELNNNNSRQHNQNDDDVDQNVDVIGSSTSPKDVNSTQQNGKVVKGSITTYDVSLVNPVMKPVYMELINGNQSETAVGPPSPYPPLCFHVNARPPEGYVYYFAYGIDMNPSRFSSYICREGVDRFWGLLFGFKLRFNKKGLDEDAGGFPNIEYEQNSSVEGALYMIRKEELTLVDNSMGYPEYVEKVMMPVWFLNCTDPDEMGVAQYCVPAVTYVARDTWTVKDTSNLSTEYAVRQCVRAADLLSPAYKEYMISQIS